MFAKYRILNLCNRAAQICSRDTVVSSHRYLQNLKFHTNVYLICFNKIWNGLENLDEMIKQYNNLVRGLGKGY